MTRIVFNPISIANFAHHFHVIRGSLLNSFSFKQFTLALELFDLHFHFLRNRLKCAPHLFVISHKVRCWEKRNTFTFANYFTSQRINFHNTINLIAEEFNSISVLRVTGRENFNHIATHTKTSTLKVNVVTVILQVNQITQ